MFYQLYLFKAVPKKNPNHIWSSRGSRKNLWYPDKKHRKCKILRHFRALSFSYEKVMISVAKRPRSSLRAKIGVNTPGISRHKHTKPVKKIFETKTKNSVIFWKDATVGQKDKISQWKIANRRVFSKYSRIFCSCFEYIFYRLGVFMPVYAGCVNADFCPERRTRSLGDRYHYFFIGKR